MAKRPYEPTFKIQERVLINGDEMIVKGIAWDSNNKLYTYDVEERPHTFFFERELEKMGLKV